MRLWAKQLIPYLPKLQLLSQWRECCAICSNWANKSTPNHILVNKVMDYPIHDRMLFEITYTMEKYLSYLEDGDKDENESLKYVEIKGEIKL